MRYLTTDFSELWMQTLSIGPAYGLAYNFINSLASEALVTIILFRFIKLYPSLVFLLKKKSHFLGTRQEQFPSFL